MFHDNLAINMDRLGDRNKLTSTVLRSKLLFLAKLPEYSFLEE